MATRMIPTASNSIASEAYSINLKSSSPTPSCSISPLWPTMRSCRFRLHNTLGLRRRGGGKKAPTVERSNTQEQKLDAGLHHRRNLVKIKGKEIDHREQNDQR